MRPYLKRLSLHLPLAHTIRMIALIPFAVCLVVLPAYADTEIYTNGSLNNSTGGWGIGPTITVEDSFTLSSSANLTSLEFYVWAIPDYTLTSLDWGIVTAPMDYSAPNPATASGTLIATGGIDVYEETIALSGNYAPGTYYLNLTHAVAAPESGTYSNDAIYWAENDGPSVAYDSSYGGSLAPYSHYGQPNQGTGTGSEAFTIYGTAAASPVPEPPGIFALGLCALAVGLIVNRWRRRETLHV